jgi:hypothetical protein
LHPQDPRVGVVLALDGQFGVRQRLLGVVRAAAFAQQARHVVPGAGVAPLAQEHVE